MLLIQIIEGKGDVNRSEDIVCDLNLIDRDEFPYATTQKRRKGAAVNDVPSLENRSHNADSGCNYSAGGRVVSLHFLVIC